MNPYEVTLTAQASVNKWLEKCKKCMALPKSTAISASAVLKGGDVLRILDGVAVGGVIGNQIDKDKK